MKNYLLLPAFLTLGAAGLLSGCGKDPAPTGPALSAPTSSPADVGADAGATAGANTGTNAAPNASAPAYAPNSPLPPGVSPTASSILPPGTPSLAQQQKIKAAANLLLNNFEAGQNAAAQNYEHYLAAWKDKQAALAQARKAAETARQELQKKLANPDLTDEEREDLANLPTPEDPRDDSPMPPSPSSGDPKTNQSFDDLIYKFRQAASARDHERAATVMAQMAELAPKISPALMAIWKEDARQYLASVSQAAPAPTAP